MPAELHRPLRVLVVDDEPLARLRLEDLLAQEPDVALVGTADNGVAAVSAIRTLQPDLVFLDVQMPGKTGLEVVREVGPEAMPATIFVTAFDHYALQAFDVAAVDYLVKPFDDERFEQAFRRARRLLELEGIDRLRAQLLAVLQGTPGPGAGSAPAPGAAAGLSPALPAGDAAAAVSAAAAPGGGYLERIAVEMRGKLRVVPVAQIDYITASGPYAELHVGERTYVIREAMQTLEERLDPAHFFRVHRSAIVRLDLVETLHKGAGGDYEIQLRGGARLRVSRSRREALEQRLGVAP
ncbi:MAG TPA: LytTR family DNA-binding domain-containing protein [Gemmatimonadaceae bacterium]|nr:LytTR family DNA-binding domain-containing protein [Gemmatimonadaceae bacterium]